MGLPLPWIVLALSAMPATHALIDLLGEVALLLWGVHMVRSGVLRAFGSGLRRLLGRALRNRLAACLAGAVVTLALQSSTATALMATSFLASGVIGLVPALAVMLGANVGTALVVSALSFDVTLVFPGLILAGLVAFRVGETTRTRNLGRAGIGLGLILLALHLIVATMAPAGVAPEARDLVAVATREPLPVLVATAVLAWAMHSSIATVLVIAALAGAGLVAPEASLAMVLGANLGSAFNPLVAATARDRVTLRLPVANLANRLLGCALAFPFLADLAEALARVVPDPGRLVAAFHLLFNAALAFLFILPLPAVARLLERALPDQPRPDDPGTPRYLDPASLAVPAVALANAARETLRMVDVVETMLQGSRELLACDDRRLAARLRRTDDVLDRLHVAIKRFLGELGQTGLSEAERARLSDILKVALNLEHAGDIVDKGLLALATKRIRRRQRLSAAELAEAEAMHRHLLAQLRLAAAVFLTEDLSAALRLVEEKERFRALERAVTERQFARLQEGRRAIETSSLHLDLVRDLKRIEAHLAAIAHPLLERSNLLSPSRLLRLPRAAGTEDRRAEGMPSSSADSKG
jgi:phosphate:Na+ symporter